MQKLTMVLILLHFNILIDGSGFTKVIDRSILWKKAMEKKYGTYDEVVIPVVEKIVSIHYVTYVSLH